jgi:FtsP/CotA-like multicopper oxidase with cupredoxin domain
MKKIACFWLSFLILGTASAYAKVVTYQFDINTKPVNITGENVVALAINNQIPGPTIEATVGDTLEVTFNNKMDTETSIHWHGILLPNDQDGVPYLTTQPIAPHSSFTYRYKITHHGTYWYHSHTGLQEQRGIYGSLVFRPKDGERVKSDKDYVVVLSDWTNENPNQVLSNLKKDGDYYALKKGSVQSWDKVISNGTDFIFIEVPLPVGSLTKLLEVGFE